MSYSIRTYSYVNEELLFAKPRRRRNLLALKGLSRFLQMSRKWEKNTPEKYWVKFYLINSKFEKSALEIDNKKNLSHCAVFLWYLTVTWIKLNTYGNQGRSVLSFTWLILTCQEQLSSYKPLFTNRVIFDRSAWHSVNQSTGLQGKETLPLAREMFTLVFLLCYKIVHQHWISGRLAWSNIAPFQTLSELCAQSQVLVSKLADECWTIAG